MEIIHAPSKIIDRTVQASEQILRTGSIKKKDFVHIREERRNHKRDLTSEPNASRYAKYEKKKKPNGFSQARLKFFVTFILLLRLFLGNK